MSPNAPSPERLPLACSLACSRAGVKYSRYVLVVNVATQKMTLFERVDVRGGFAGRFPQFCRRRAYLISTSRFGIGQVADSNRTPLGLHRVATKVGAGWPVGTVFRGRKPIGLTWGGNPEAPIAHRILWLDGLEPGWNRGGNCDSYSRYIYIHGVGNETTLGRPCSRGCIHMAARDLVPLFDDLPPGTLVWIAGTGPR